MVEPTISITDISIIVGILSLLLGIYLFFEKKMSAQAADIKAVSDALAAHKVETAKEYASRDNILEMESRVMDAITRLGNRLDQILAKAFEAH